MTATVPPHEPTPEFRAHLEWQIASALRRESRFAEPATAPRAPWLRLVAMLAVAFALGSMVTIASGEVQESRQTQRLVEAVNAELRLVQLRREVAEQALADSRKRFDLGTAGREEMMEAEQQLAAVDATLTKSRLDLEEIKLTAAAPRDELNAPLVGGRDFVSARIEAELRSAEFALSVQENGLAVLKRRMSVGTATQSSRLLHEIEVARAVSVVQTLRGKLELRKRALKTNMKAEEVVTAQRRMELTVTLERSQREIEMMRGRVQEIRAMFEVGMASQLELRRAEVQLLELEVDAQMARRALEALGGKRE